ncbi:hypothetical protein [Umezawaea sp. NPDC059074]|uniref:hypothetical protein n=1 Tax=Umezawaea sp. NPDC059074 TaxID=3346716 RepID=UPI00368F3C28
MEALVKAALDTLDEESAALVAAGLGKRYRREYHSTAVRGGDAVAPIRSTTRSRSRSPTRMVRSAPPVARVRPSALTATSENRSYGWTVMVPHSRGRDGPLAADLAAASPPALAGDVFGDAVLSSPTPARAAVARRALPLVARR